MRIFMITLLIALNSITASSACLNTYQFKTFPVGISNDKIITVDVQIRRTSKHEGNRWLDLGLKDLDHSGQMWIIYPHITAYNKDQTIQAITSLDTVYTFSNNYRETLLAAYQSGFDKILQQYPSIELFTPDYLSFCDYQQKCNLLSMKKDTLNTQGHLLYQGQKYLTPIVNDSTYYAFDNSPYFSKNISGYYLNSIRIYRSATVTLIVCHLTTGHEIAMGWITDDPNKTPENEGDPVIVSKEYRPEIAFADIENAVFQEPLLHHGYGFDLFVIK